MLLVKNGISQSRIHNLQTTSRSIDDCTGAIIHGKRSNILILVIYRKSRLKKKGTWNKLLNKYNDNKIIIIGDLMKAHNILWNCHRTNRNRLNLAEEYEDEGLFIINMHTIPRIGEVGR